MKKIIRIIGRLNIGGPAVHVILLTGGLDRSKFDSLLVTGSVSTSEGNMNYLAVQKNVFPVVISQLKREINPLTDLLALVKIYMVILSEKPDILHTHTAKAGTLGRIGGILYSRIYPRKDLKMVHTFHGHIFEGYFNKTKVSLFLLIEKLLAFFTDRIITLSGTLKQELLSLGIGNDKKIRIIPLGLELEKFTNIKLKEFGQSINIGIIGRLVPVKDHRLFLDMAAELLKDYSRSRFKIIGEGELMEDLKGYSRSLGLTGFVEFSGWRRDLPLVYSGLDMVCLTSINEGTPLSLIEAMASARPAIATDAGGVRDLLGEEIPDNLHSGAYSIRERGVLVEARDPLKFARAVARMINDKELRMRLSVSGREFVKDKFSRVRLISDTENLYNQLFM